MLFYYLNNSVNTQERMDYFFVKLCLLYFVFVFSVDSFDSFSVYQEGKSLQEKIKLTLPQVTCSSESIEAVFGPQVRRNVKVKDSTGVVIPVTENEFCGVKLAMHENKSLVILSKYDSCFALFEDRAAVIPLHIQLSGENQWYRVNVSCPLMKRTRDHSPPSTATLPTECKFPKSLRVICGHQKSQVSSMDCSKFGCCYDDHDKICFYKLNSCSLDGHFVFSVTAEDIDYLPISPNNFIVKDHPHCFPVITTSDTAVFKVGLTQCGVKMLERDEAMVYEVEVEDSTDGSFSLQVSCEYEPSERKTAASSSALFVVTNPPPAVALGNVEVQMRIARDASFTSFYAEDELPVTLPLRETAHIEISIAQPSPDQSLSLRVRDCFAYPSTKDSVWNLLHDGCPNTVDDMHSSIPENNEGKITLHSQVRRFNVRTFAFMDQNTGHHSTEPVYFYCWVEICTKDMDCAQYCSISSSKVERKRREALYMSNNLRLLSLEALVIEQNDTQVEENQCQKSKRTFQGTLYFLFGIIAALLLIVLCIAFKISQRCWKAKAHVVVIQENTDQ